MLRISDPNSGKGGKCPLHIPKLKPNLVRGDPEGYLRRLRCIRAWGGAPFQMASRSRKVSLRKF